MSLLQQIPAWSWYIAPAFLFLITVVVFFHELGHFSLARFFGVKIETFSIGFGRGILKWKDSHGTDWKIGWIPLGGFVKFYGDADGASTPDREGAARMTAAERAVAFPFKPLWQRALIVAAGPVANFILAIVILTGIFMIHGQAIVPAVVGKVQPHGAAALAGIRTGDRIVAVDGTAISTYKDLLQIVALSAGQPLPVVLERGHARMTVWATPQENTDPDQFGNRQNIGDLGFDLPAPPAVIDTMLPGKPAEAAGLRPGDRIVSLDGRPVADSGDVFPVVSGKAGKDLVIGFRRGAALLTTHLVPVLNDKKKGMLGITFVTPVVLNRLGPVDAFVASLAE